MLPRVQSCLKGTWERRELARQQEPSGLGKRKRGGWTQTVRASVTLRQKVETSRRERGGVELLFRTLGEINAQYLTKNRAYPAAGEKGGTTNAGSAFTDRGGLPRGELILRRSRRTDGRGDVVEFLRGNDSIAAERANQAIVLALTTYRLEGNERLGEKKK